MEKNNLILFAGEPKGKVSSLADNVLALHEAIIHNHLKKTEEYSPKRHKF